MPAGISESTFISIPTFLPEFSNAFLQYTKTVSLSMDLSGVDSESVLISTLPISRFYLDLFSSIICDVAVIRLLIEQSIAFMP